MSRTDAHVPYWVWSKWYEPSHDVWCEFYLNRYWQDFEKYPCNLPKQAVRHRGTRIKGRRTPDMQQCTWEPVWPGRDVRWMSGWKWGGTPHWFIRHVWNGPERVRQRTLLGKLTKEYNATGDLDDGDFPNYQTRHCARWLWD